MRTFLVNKNGLQNSYGWSIVNDGRVMYSGYLNGKEEDLMVDEYVKLEGKQDLIEVSEIEFDAIFDNYEKSLCKPWVEIDEDRWYEMLECLPPGRWRDLNSRFNIFYCIEAYTSSLHSHFVKDRVSGKYYEALRSRYTKNEEFINQLNELL